MLLKQRQDDAVGRWGRTPHPTGVKASSSKFIRVTELTGKVLMPSQKRLSTEQKITNPSVRGLSTLYAGRVIIPDKAPSCAIHGACLRVLESPIAASHLWKEPKESEEPP